MDRGTFCLHGRERGEQRGISRRAGRPCTAPKHAVSDSEHRFLNHEWLQSLIYTNYNFDRKTVDRKSLIINRLTGCRLTFLLIVHEIV